LNVSCVFKLVGLVRQHHTEENNFLNTHETFK
jgi:hypothetical protein